MTFVNIYVLPVTLDDIRRFEQLLQAMKEAYADGQKDGKVDSDTFAVCNVLFFSAPFIDMIDSVFLSLFIN